MMPNLKSVLFIALYFQIVGNAVAQCDTYEYYRKLSNGQANRVDKLLALSDGSALAVGFTGSLNLSDGLIVKISRLGNIVWANKIGLPAVNSRVVNAVETSDGGIAVIGQINLSSGSATFISKLNAGGNLVWTKTYPSFSFNISHPASIIELAGGGFAVTAIYASPFPPSGFIMRTDASGNIAWAKSYVTGFSFTTTSNAIVQVGNNLLVTGLCETFTSTINHYRYLMSVQVSDGAVTSLKRWPDANGDLFRTMDKAGDKIFLSFLNNNERIFWQTDAGLNSIQAVRHPGGTGALVLGDFAATADTAFIHVQVGTSLNDIRFAKIKNNALDFVKAIQLVAGDAASNPAVEQNNTGEIISAFTVTNSTTNNLQDLGFILARPDFNINNICNIPAATYQLDPRNINVENFTWAIYNDYTLTPSSQVFFNTPLAFTNDLICTYTNADPCTTLDLPEADTVCITNNATRFTAIRSNGCIQAVQFQIDPNFAQIVSSTDTTIDLRFLQTGSVKLYATITSTCSVLKDSIAIFIGRHADSLTIGRDTSFCGQAQFTFSGEPGFASYLWQDGTTGQVFTTNNAGTYHLTVTDHCGNVFRDSVQVTELTPPVFDLGADKSICVGDTVAIAGPAGFSIYNWQPAINIINNNSQTASVHPQNTTKYYLYAHNDPSCVSVDSIIVNVNTAAAIGLPSDRSICIGDTVTLTAPGNFLQYSWSTGAISASIAVSQIGLYTLEAIDLNGCKSRDSFGILNVFQNPEINLGLDSVICTSQTRILDAGSGTGWQYTWQDGSTGQTFQITDTGFYHVNVSDANGCKGQDSIHINKLMESPGNFLPGDTSICFPNNLAISSLQDLSNYQWSTGSISNSINISSPGLYWLKATNIQGCSAADSIVVADKSCGTNIYFPAAFTPNQDGTNDIFKPGIFGSLANYEFSIFNRYGEQVFHSTNSYLGWNGMLNGKPQNTGTYTWVCKYQFVGSLKQFSKGTVILIR